MDGVVAGCMLPLLECWRGVLHGSGEGGGGVRGRDSVEGVHACVANVCVCLRIVMYVRCTGLRLVDGISVYASRYTTIEHLCMCNECMTCTSSVRPPLYSVLVFAATSRYARERSR